MRSKLIVPFFSCLVLNVAAAETGESFEGFSLGMPRSDATKVRPDVAWKVVMKDTPTEAIRKEFTAHHLGKPAQAGVDLDQSGKFVSVIGFGFATQTDQQCITDAVGALAELERRYGTSYNATDQPPGKRATWIAKSGVVVRWAELCAAGARRYFISYAKNEN